MNIYTQTKKERMCLAKLVRADVLPTLHPSSNPPSRNLDYIKVDYRLYKNNNKKTEKKTNVNMCSCSGFCQTIHK